MECIADWEKAQFKSHQGSQSQRLLSKELPFITTGLWRYSRHPNYFGECLLWTGVWLMAYNGTQDKRLAVLTFATCPLQTFVLLVFISGIPAAESLDEKRYKRLVAYNQYRMITSPLVPMPTGWYANLAPPLKYWLFMERSLPVGAGRPIKRRRLRSDLGGTGSGVASALGASGSVSGAGSVEHPSSSPQLL